ncbi:MAG: mannose-1-phosphate guanylyltransferase/mannose-6-phosphate isomerase [Pseudomonadota bacterium]
MSPDLPKKIIPIILAGGSGTRLWPASRDTFPKQFIALIDAELSTFQSTIKRVSHPLFDRPIVITNDEFRFTCGEQLRTIGVEADLVLEPFGRDSAAAVAVGALMALQRDGDAICMALAADHLVQGDEAFVADCARAAKFADDGFIMTMGIAPTGPSSAYGYIQRGAEQLGDRASRIERFVEKPDQTKAAQYVHEGYLWNSGNFVFQAARMVEELETNAPDVVEGARASLEAKKLDLDFHRLDKDEFAKVPKISIDYAVMEKTNNGGVLEASYGWSDIGTWDALYDVQDKDPSGNVVEGNARVFDTSNSLVRSDGILTTVLGIDDVVVVTTDDAVLVCNRSKAGSVKSLVAEIKKEGLAEGSEHLRTHRPWGWYERLDRGDRFQVKHISVKPGGRLSLQRHHHRAEHWIVVHGTAEVTIDGEVMYRHENESVYLPIGCVHRLHNPGKIELNLIEIQVGSYTGEDDIVRLEDVYARD